MRRQRFERVYLVDWSGLGIFKIGYTTDPRRPTRLAERGGRVLAISDFSPGSGLATECHLLGVAAGMFPPAFKEADEAVRILGRHGGWMECFSGDAAKMLSVFDWEWVNP